MTKSEETRDTRLATATADHSLVVPCPDQLPEQTSSAMHICGSNPSAAMDLAAGAAAKCTTAKRQVGCAVIDQASGALIALACNGWDNPILPGKGVCAELNALAGLAVRGGLYPLPKDEDVDDGSCRRLTLAVTNSPCEHCAATILLFKEVVDVQYGNMCDDGTTIAMLEAGGVKIAHVPFRKDDSSNAAPIKDRPRPLPAPSQVRASTLRGPDDVILATGSEPRATVIAAARTHQGLPSGCTLSTDAPLDYMEKLFCAACGVVAAPVAVAV